MKMFLAYLIHKVHLTTSTCQNITWLSASLASGALPASPASCRRLKSGQSHYWIILSNLCPPWLTRCGDQDAVDGDHNAVRRLSQDQIILKIVIKMSSLIHQEKYILRLTCLNTFTMDLNIHISVNVCMCLYLLTFTLFGILQFPSVTGQSCLLGLS